MPKGKKALLNTELFNSGSRVKGRNLQLFVQKDVNCAEPLFCVAKKIYHNKPQRNRLRRLLKEAYRRQNQKLGELGYRVALLVTVATVTLSDLELELQALTQKVLQK